jgi:hypothetical protein
MADSPWIQKLRNLLEKHSAEKIASVLFTENLNVVSLAIALCQSEKRKDLFLLLSKTHRKEVANILPGLKFPPDFVLQAIFESLSEKLKGFRPILENGLPRKT